MKSDELLDAIGGIDYRHVLSAETRKKHSKKWMAWTAVACAGLVIFGAWAYHAENPYPVIYLSPDTSDGCWTVQVPRWEDMTVSLKYSEITVEGKQYSARNGEIPEARVGELIAHVTASGWDKYAEEKRFTDAAVYTISGISPACAVAVHFEGEEGYYAACRIEYLPETLGQFISDLDLENTLNINFASCEYRKPLSGEWITVRYEGVESAKLWELIADCLQAEEVFELEENELPDLILSLSVDVPILGYRGVSLSFRENGYLMTNILGTGKMFCIGEERVRSFVEYVRKECTGYQVVMTKAETGIPE